MEKSATHNLRKFNEVLVIHFGVEDHIINAETLGNSLIGFSTTIKLIDSRINNGSTIEFIIEATEQGSFKVVARTVRKSLNNLFSIQNVNGLAISLLASAIWYWIQPSDEVKITVNTDEYIIEKGDEKIILPREAEPYFDSIRKNKRIQEEVSKTFKNIEEDKTVSGIEFHSSNTVGDPDFVVNRDSFDILATLADEEKEENIVEVDATLIIIKAILEKSLRRWQFKWNHKRISAPILDFDFYADFGAHKITIAPGDTLDVRLKIVTEKDIELGITTEKSYEITEVYKHYSRTQK